jgi:hypothetical protein
VARRLFALAAAVVTLASGDSALAEPTDLQIAEALRRHVCFSRIWWGDPYARLGQTVTFDLRTEGRTTYAWSEDLRAIPRVRRWADSYAIVARGAGPVVVQRSGYNAELLRGDPAFERERRRVYGGASRRLRVALPADCTPRFDAETPLKAEMRQIATSSLTNALRTWGRRPAGGRLRLTLADFNVDSPETFAVREDTGEVLRIGLIGADRSSYSGGAGRQYVVSPVPAGPAAILLRRLVRRHGAPLTITLASAPPP